MSDQKLEENEKASQDYKQSLDNIIKKEGFITYNITETKLTLTGESYLGTIHEVDVEGKTEHGEKEVHIFVKQIIPDVKLDFMSIEECYDKECFAYKEIFKMYQEIQDSANIAVDERFKFAKSYEETNNQFIILENLSRRGYKTLSRMSIMPVAFAELSIKQMARLHGLSIVLDNQNPEYFAAKIKTIKTIYKIDNTDAFYKFVENMLNVSKSYLNEESNTRLESTLFESYKEDIQKALKPTKFLNCLCHGDYKTTNIMYKEMDGEIIDVIAVDYQLSYYGNPIIDFMYFILLGTDRDFRQKHLEHLKDLYHDTMKTFLTFFNTDLDLLLPRKEFENQFRDSLRYYLLWAIIALPFLLASEDDVPDLKTDDLNTLDIKADGIFNVRLQEIVDECIDWGVI